MPNTVRRWLILGAALAASIIVSVLLRPADSLGENPVVYRDEKVGKTVERLSNILQSEAISVSQLANPFARPGEPAADAPKESVGVQMIGWVRLSGTDYALIATSSGERYVQVGDKLGDWQVTQVAQDQTVFAKGAVHEVVKLKERFSVTPLN